MVRTCIAFLLSRMIHNLDQRPIFVHASHRSGSTYFFNVLRRMEPLLCFNEAINDQFSLFGKKFFVRGTKDFARRVARGQFHRVHYFLKSGYNAEFIDAWDNAMHLYPAFPAFRDYVPQGGILPIELQAYLAALIDYASANKKRAVLCEVFSRGRAGALRRAFAGFHIAQYRDPISQFGSSFRTFQEVGGITFMIIPLWELGLSSGNPLYSLIPEVWRVPGLPWPVDDHAQRWASTQQYLSMIISSEPGTLEKVFRWHLLSWFLNNLAAIIHSDFVLDIDRAFDDRDYRQSVCEMILSEIGVAPDLSDMTKFSRYYRFDDLDMVRIRDEVVAMISAAHENGRLEASLRAAFGGESSTMSPTLAIEILRAKLDAALAEFSSSDKIIDVTSDDWRNIVEQRRYIWANPCLRDLMRRIFPVVFPLVQATRVVRSML
jgi:hypothetical protein